MTLLCLLERLLDYLSGVSTIMTDYFDRGSSLFFFVFWLYTAIIAHFSNLHHNQSGALPLSCLNE